MLIIFFCNEKMSKKKKKKKMTKIVKVDGEDLHIF